MPSTHHPNAASRPFRSAPTHRPALDPSLSDRLQVAALGARPTGASRPIGDRPTPAFLAGLAGIAAREADDVSGRAPSPTRRAPRAIAAGGVGARLLAAEPA